MNSTTIILVMLCLLIVTTTIFLVPNIWKINQEDNFSPEIDANKTTEEGYLDLSVIKPPQSDHFDNYVRRVEDSIAKQNNHAWAGFYYYNEFDKNEKILKVSVDHEYYFQSFIGGYECFKNCGKVKKNGNKLYFERGLSELQSGGDFPERMMYLVTWGKRNYLIPPNEMVEFCNDVNLGFEPSNTHQISPGTYLRKGEHKIKVNGFPAVPQKYQAYLLSHPINAKAISYGDKVPNDQYPPGMLHFDREAVLNVGRKDGVLSGLKFCYNNSKRETNFLKVTSVEEERCRVVITHQENFNPDEILEWKLSTHRK